MTNLASVAWDELRETIDTIREELLAIAPDEATAAEAESYLMRLMTAGLDDACLSHLRSESGLTRALPTRGAPNPDYIMWHAAIDPTHLYRLDGCLHGSERVGIGLYTVNPNGAPSIAAYRVFDRNAIDGNGLFSVELGAMVSGPSALPIPLAARVLLVRVLHRASQAQACTLMLTGGPEKEHLHTISGSAQQMMSRCAQGALRAARLYMKWSRATSGSPNAFIAPPPAMADEVQSDPDTTYGLGGYDLGEGEWLEAQIPQGLRSYWSLHTYNHWCESLPHAGIHDLQAVPDADGRVRLRIGPAVPFGLANRIDTLGRRRGALVYRSIGSSGAELPQVSLRQ